MNTSRERAEEILSLHLSALTRCAGDILQSVVLVGSLSNGTYTGDSGSDIDLIHIIRDDAPGDSRQRILSLIQKTEQETSRDIPISRCVYRLRDLYRPYPSDFPLCLDNKDYIELPIEILRMKNSGRTLWGEDILSQIDAPLREDILACKQRSRDWAALEAQRGFRPIPDDQLPIRLIVQSVLVRAMLDYYFSTGISCSNKSAVAGLLRRDVPQYAFLDLADACTKWRYLPGAFTQEDQDTINCLWALWVQMRTGRDIDFVPLT